MNRKLNSLLVGTLIISAAIFSGCNSPEQKVDDAAENVTAAQTDLTAAKENYANEVANFKKESNGRITSNEKTIAELKSKMINEKKEIKEEYNKMIDAMETKNSEMKKRMEDYHEDGQEKWQSFKNEFNHDMNELGNSLKGFTIDNK